MKLTININMDNAAFEDGDELSRILRTVAFELEDHYEPDERNIRDINGNKVGKWVIED